MYEHSISAKTSNDSEGIILKELEEFEKIDKEMIELVNLLRLRLEPLLTPGYNSTMNDVPQEETPTHSIISNRLKYHNQSLSMSMNEIREIINRIEL